MLSKKVYQRALWPLANKFNRKFSSKYPLNINLFRSEEQLESVRQSLKRRFRDVSLADHIAISDKKVRSLRFGLEQHRKELNRLVKDLGKAVQSGSGEVQSMKNLLSTKKEQQKQMSEEVEKEEGMLEQLVLQVGNLVHNEAPVSQDEQHNVVRHTYGVTLSKTIPYWDVLERLDAVDMKRGQKLAGHRGYFLKGVGVKLAKALANLSLGFLEKEGYTLYETPLMVKEEFMRQCCQLSDLEKEMYKLQGQDTVLIATSQQSLACMYRQQTIEQLPLRMAGFSTCFRKEAGAHGKDNQGLFRVHQFEKAQQFVICKQEESQKELQRMLQTSMKFYREVLPLPFRVVEIVSGALNDSANRKYDLQAWFPAAGRYRQLVSVSNCTDYQSRMLEIRYRQGQQNKYAHMLNGTLCAIQRTMCCLLESYASTDGIHLPEQLARSYGSATIGYVK